MSIPDRLKSRKLWAAFCGALLPVIAAYLSGDVALPEAIQASTAVICSYIFGQGAVDAMAAREGSNADA